MIRWIPFSILLLACFAQSLLAMSRVGPKPEPTSSYGGHHRSRPHRPGYGREPPRCNYDMGGRCQPNSLNTNLGNLARSFFPLDPLEICMIQKFCSARSPGVYCLQPLGQKVSPDCESTVMLECPLGLVSICRSGYVCRNLLKGAAGGGAPEDMVGAATSMPFLDRGMADRASYAIQNLSAVCVPIRPPIHYGQKGGGKLAADMGRGGPDMRGPAMGGGGGADRRSGGPGTLPGMAAGGVGQEAFDANGAFSPENFLARYKRPVHFCPLPFRTPCVTKTLVCRVTRTLAYCGARNETMPIITVTPTIVVVNGTGIPVRSQPTERRRGILGGGGGIVGAGQGGQGGQGGAFPEDQGGAFPEDQGGAFPGQDQGGAFPGAEQGGFPGQDQGGFPGAEQGGAFPGAEQGGAFPGQDQGGAFPGQDQGGAFPGAEQGAFPGAEQGAFPGAEQGGGAIFPGGGGGGRRSRSRRSTSTIFINRRATVVVANQTTVTVTANTATFTANDTTVTVTANGTSITLPSGSGSSSTSASSNSSSNGTASTSAPATDNSTTASNATSSATSPSSNGTAITTSSATLVPSSSSSAANPANVPTSLTISNFPGVPPVSFTFS